MKQLIVTVLTVLVLAITLSACVSRKNNNNNKVPLSTAGSSDDSSTAFVNDVTDTTAASGPESSLHTNKTDKAVPNENEIDAGELFGDSNGQVSGANGQQTQHKPSNASTTNKKPAGKTESTGATTSKILDKDGDGWIDDWYKP